MTNAIMPEMASLNVINATTNVGEAHCDVKTRIKTILDQKWNRISYAHNEFCSACGNKEKFQIALIKNEKEYPLNSTVYLSKSCIDFAVNLIIEDSYEKNLTLCRIFSSCLKIMSSKLVVTGNIGHRCKADLYFLEVINERKFTMQSLNSYESLSNLKSKRSEKEEKFLSEVNSQILEVFNRKSEKKQEASDPDINMEELNLPQRITFQSHSKNLNQNRIIFENFFTSPFPNKPGRRMYLETFPSPASQKSPKSRPSGRRELSKPINVPINSEDLISYAEFLHFEDSSSFCSSTCPTINSLDGIPLEKRLSKNGSISLLAPVHYSYQ